MKQIILLLFLISFTSYAGTDFFSLSEDEKIEILDNKAEDIWDEELFENFKKTNKAFMKKLQQFAISQSDVWWDTIYEGPYSPVSDNVEVELYSLYKYKGKIVAVRASISQKAVMIDDADCEVDYDAMTWSEECYEGYVSESFYMDLKGNFLDTGEYADFDY